MRLCVPLWVLLASAGLLLSPAGAPAQEPASGSRFYGGTDYLLWWMKGAPLGVPLVSTGPIATTHHGLVGPPAENGADTVILYGAPHPPAQGGNDTQNLPPFSAGRLTLGYWLDDDQAFAVEGSGFLTARRSAGYHVRSDTNGNPVLGFPVFNSVPYSIGTMTIFPGEDSLPFGLPNDPNRVRGNNGIIVGGAKILNHLRLWGADAMGVVNLAREDSWELSGLAGFRYLNLAETFNLESDIEGVSGMYAGQVGVVRDTFQTRTQFYGASMGLRGRYLAGPLSLDVTGRLGLGVSREMQNVLGGYFSYNFRAPFDYGPEGVFAQPANEGRRRGNRFAVVPEGQVKLGYALTSWLRATVGYDIIYWSSVMRPGDQINRALPKGQTFNQADPVVSSTSPNPLFRPNDFYAHGLSFGLDFRF